VARFNLQRLGQMLAGARVPRFLPIIPQGASAEAQSSESLADLLKDTASEERLVLIAARIREHAGRILGTGSSQLDLNRSLSEMGLDSLMAVELAEAVERDVAKPISVMQMLSAGTISAIADLVLKTLGLGSEADGITVTSSAAKEKVKRDVPGSAPLASDLAPDVVKSKY
jgi:acyl carrier protein